MAHFWCLQYGGGSRFVARWTLGDDYMKQTSIISGKHVFHNSPKTILIFNPLMAGCPTYKLFISYLTENTVPSLL